MAFIVVYMYLLTWHYANTRDTCMSMVFHILCIFVLLAHAFAHILVSPAINNVDDVLYIVAGQYTRKTMISHVSIIHVRA